MKTNITLKVLCLIITCILMQKVSGQNSPSSRTVSFKKSQKVLSKSILSVNNTLATSIDITVDIPDVYISNIKNPQSDFNQIISITGCNYISKTGYPALPEIRRAIAIPDYCDIDDVTLNIYSTEDTVLNGMNVSPVPKIIDNKSKDFHRNIVKKYLNDESIYSRNSFYPEKQINIEKTGYIRDQKVLWITIYPVQYNAYQKKVEISHLINFRINSENSISTTNLNLGPFNECAPELFLNADKNNVINFAEVQETGTVSYPVDLTSTENSADYLIITTEDLITSSALDSLAQYHAEYNNFAVAIVNVNDIYQQFPSDTGEVSIKNFLIYAYHNWYAPQIGDHHIAYVLLAGEGAPNSMNNIPIVKEIQKSAYGEVMKSDFWYSCINDDNGDGMINTDDRISDIIIGRLSVETHQELSIVVQKIIQYEEDLENSIQEWRQKICIANSFNEEDYYLRDDESFKELEYIVNNQDFYKISENLLFIEMPKDQFRESFIQAINNGRAIVNVNAHGGIDGLGDGTGWRLFSSSDIANLSNTNKYPIFFSLSCNTGALMDSSSDCLGELFVNTKDKGAISFIGATIPVPTPNNNIFKTVVNCANSTLGACLFFSGFFEQNSYAYVLLGDPALRYHKNTQHHLSDLCITSSDISLEWISETNALIKVTIHNYGFIDAENVSIQLYINDPGNENGILIVDQMVNSIKKHGGNRIIKINTPILINEDSFVYVIVDPSNMINELSEDNNHASLPIKRLSFYHCSDITGIVDTCIGPGAWGDYNNDGMLDLVTYDYYSGIKLYQNSDSGQFINVTDQAKITQTRYSSYSIIFLDINNDGFQDIILSNYDYFYYKNNGNNTFNPEFLLTDKNQIIETRMLRGFFDYDNDGLLDMYAQYDPSQKNLINNVLYHNNGDETYTCINEGAGLDSAYRESDIAYGDYDNDGDIDIYLARSKGNLLYQNNSNGTFSDITQIFGNPGIGGKPVFVDFDNDGNLDLFLFKYGYDNKLYQNSGSGTFHDVAIEKNIKYTHDGNDISFFDYNNDGYIDLFIVDRNYKFFYKSNEYYEFTLDTTNIIYHSDNSRFNSVGDYDNNGFLDIYCSKDSSNRMIYSNKGNNNNWLILDLKGTKSNSQAIGTRVRIVTENLTQIREITCKFPGYIHTSFPVEFGLGEYNHVDSLEIKWPGGIIDIFTSVQANKVMTIKEGYGDIDIPVTTKLFQNYPNPFNSVSTIEYIVAGDPHNPDKSSQVAIHIFNILGQKVKTLVNRVQKPGKYSVKWDGTSRFGNQVASGIYLYQIKTGGIRKSRKMIFIK